MEQQPKSGAQPKQGLTQQEQQMTAGIMDNAADVYSPMAEKLQKSQNPVADVGTMAGQLFHTILISANKAGKNIPKNVSQKVLKSLVEDVMEIAHGIGAVQFDSQEQATKMTGIALKAAAQAYVHQEKAAAGRAQQPGQPDAQPTAAPPQAGGPPPQQPGMLAGGPALPENPGYNGRSQI